MPRGYTQVPSPPKLRRRDTGEAYEWVCLGMWFLLGLTIIYLLDFAKIPGTPELNPDNRLYGIMFIGSLFCLDTLALMRFDYLAKSRVKEDYELKMKEYKKLRDIYIENQSKLLKMQQDTYVSGENVIQMSATSDEELESSDE
jgi:hypothetical protein